jgi:hypothetical protein
MREKFKRTCEGIDGDLPGRGRERAKLGRLPRRASCASGSGIGFVWSRLIGLATAGAIHAVDDRSKVGRKRQ